MQDTIPKGTGNSLLIKSVSDFLTKYPTYEDMAAALVAGTFPIDLMGLNADGVSQEGTPLNTQNLLSDTAAAAMAAATGEDAPSTPSEAFSQIAAAVTSGAKIATGTYYGSAAYGSGAPNTLTFDFKPNLVLVYESNMGMLFGDTGSSANNAMAMLAARGATATGRSYGSNNASLHLTWGDNSLSWYSDSDWTRQFNYPSALYRYIAIGE